MATSQLIHRKTLQISVTKSSEAMLTGGYKRVAASGREGAGRRRAAE